MLSPPGTRRALRCRGSLYGAKVGMALAEHLVAAGNRIPVIFITSYFDEKIRARLLQAGAAGFLRKPFSYDGFVDCLNTTLANSGRRLTKK